MVKKLLFNVFSVVALLMLTTSAMAHGTHYGKFSATTTGNGKVYVSLDENADPVWSETTSDATWNCSGTANGDRKTGYFKAQAEEGFVFLGWFKNEEYYKGQANYSESLSAGSGSSQENPTTLALEAKFTDFAVDISSALKGSWTAQNNKSTREWDEGTEVYNGNNDPFAEGNVLTQTVNVVNGFYEIQFYAFENWADWDESANIPYGENICEAFANDAKYSLTSIRSKGDRAFDESTLVKMICEVTDGTLTYGLRNIAEGGNWAVCKAKSLVFLGDTKVSAAVSDEAQYATFCAPFEVALPEGVTASTVKGVEGGLLTLTPVEGVLPANTAVILNAEAGLESTDFYGFSKATGTTVTTGLLTGVYVDTEITEGYVMQKQDKVGFYEVISANPKTVPAYHAYLTAPAGARFFGIDGETAIEAVDALTSGKAEIFDLQGRRLNRLQKGINIVNGVKILVK